MNAGVTLRVRLLEQLRRYDDDAFAALANRGLLRRAGKDLETQTPTIVEDGEATLAIVFLGHTIRFDARGPAQATCTCPSAGVCQHILAGALWLQRRDAMETSVVSSTVDAVAASAAASATEENLAGESTEAAAPQNDVDDPLRPLHAALLAFAARDLGKYAGKAGYRWAWQFVHDLDPERGLRIGGERYLQLSFAQPRIGFRYLGGGLDDLIADAQIAAVEKYRVAAVLAYQRAHGVEPVAPDTLHPPRAAALDLGKDHALAARGDDAQREARTRLRARLRELLGDCVRLGLSHLSPDIQQRYATLAVWAQGAEYYRLALLLRRIADHVEMLLDRAGGADEHRLFEEATVAYALVSALEAADARGEAPQRLIGRARHRYDTAERIELLGLGAIPWRAASGYIGLTMLFWSPAERAFLSCTDARPETQRGFDPVKRYRAAGPWAGLGAPAQASGRRLHLVDAQIGGLGRISASDRTQVSIDKPTAAGFDAGFAAALAPCVRWSELQRTRGLARRSLLAEPQPMDDWIVLRPTRVAAARFDPVRQRLLWPLFDDDGVELHAEIVYSDYAKPAIERLEALEPERWRTGTLIVARMRDSAEGLVAEPLSLICADSADDANPVDALYFDAAAQIGALARALPVGKAIGGLRRWLSGAQADAPRASLRPSVLPPALSDLRAWLLAQAERGIGDHPVQVGTTLAAHAQRLRRAGFSTFSSFDASSDASAASVAAEALLRAHYLLLQYARLLGQAEDAGDSEV
jgi:hypothetical protein